MTNNTRPRKGQCLCGAVTLTAETSADAVGACHCSSCRTWVGGPLMAVDCGTDVTFAGEDKITVFESSAWAERGFCAQCGSSLFYRLRQSGQYMVPVGLLESDDHQVFDHQVFVDEKPDYYDFSNTTENMTGAELFAKYAPPTD